MDIDLTLEGGLPEQGIPSLPGRDDNADESLLEISDNTSEMVKVMLKFRKLQEDVLDNVVELLGIDRQSWEWQHNEKSYNTAKGKFRSKTEEYMFRKVAAADFFTKAGQYLKGIWQNGKNFLMDVLKFLLVFSLFGPEFLDAIVGFVINVVMSIVNSMIRMLPAIVNVIAKYLPIIIHALVNAIKTIIPVLAAALPKLIGILADGLIEIIKGLAEILPILIPALVQIFMILLKEIIRALPIIIGALVQGASLLLSEITKLFNDPKFVADMMDAFGSLFKSLSENIGIIMPFIITFINELYLALIHMFDKLGEKNILFKIIAELLRMSLFFFTLMVKIVYTIVDVIQILWDAIMFLFSFFLLLSILFHRMIGSILEWFGEVLVKFFTLFMPLFRPVISFFLKLGKIVKTNIDKILSTLNSMWERVTGVFKGLWDKILSVFSPQDIGKKIADKIKQVVDGFLGEGTFEGILDKLKEMFHFIMDWVHTLLFLLAKPERSIAFLAAGGKIEDVHAAATIARLNSADINSVLRREGAAGSQFIEATANETSESLNGLREVFQQNARDSARMVKLLEQQNGGKLPVAPINFDTLRRR